MPQGHTNYLKIDYGSPHSCATLRYQKRSIAERHDRERTFMLKLRIERDIDKSSPDIAELHISRATVEEAITWLQRIRNMKLLKAILGATTSEVRSLMRDLDNVIVELRSYTSP